MRLYSDAVLRPQQVFKVGLLLALLVPWLTPSIAQTQEADGDLVQEQRRTGLWVEPRVSTGLTLTNNSRLVTVDPQSEQVLSLSAGLHVVYDGARAQGRLDYSLTGLHYVNDTFGDSVQHALDALATVNVWEGLAFVDLAGVVEREAISAFGAQSVDQFTNPNLVESARFRVSPYFRGFLGGGIEYEARYSLQRLNNDAINRSDVTTHGALVVLRNRDTTPRLGWSLQAQTQQNEYTLDRTTQSQSVLGELSYAITPQIRGSVFAGVESNDAISLDSETYSATGAGLDWRPSDRTRLNVGVERRYHGRAHNVLLEHRTSRTVWRYTDTRSVVDDSLDEALSLAGTTQYLLENLYATREPDPVKRAQLVEAELLRLGLPPTHQLDRRFLASAATLQHHQQLSFLLEGIRSVVTLSIGRTHTRRLDTALRLLGDDFDNATTISQRHWSMAYAHRLTPRTAASVSLTGLRNKSTGTSLQSSARSLGIGLTTRLGARTSANLQVQRTVFRASVNPYRVTTLIGVIAHRF